MAPDSGEIPPGTPHEVQRAAEARLRDRSEDSLTSPEISRWGRDYPKRRSWLAALFGSVCSDRERRADQTDNAVPEGVGRGLGAARGPRGAELVERRHGILSRIQPERLTHNEQNLFLQCQSACAGDHAVSSLRSSCISAKIPAGGTIPFSVT